MGAEGCYQQGVISYFHKEGRKVSGIIQF